MGIDVKVESPYGPDGEVLGDPNGFVPLFLALSASSDTKCLRFIDPYGDTVFNQLQIPVLIQECKARLRRVSADALWSHQQSALRQVRDADCASTIIREHERAANASESEVDSELSRLREHIEGVRGVLDAAVKAGPHHYVRFRGD